MRPFRVGSNYKEIKQVKVIEKGVLRGPWNGKISRAETQQAARSQLGEELRSKGTPVALKRKPAQFW